MIWPVALLLAAAAAASPTGTPTPSPAPQLSIAISDGATATNRGQHLDYTITVTNTGLTDVASLTISQTVPTGLSFDSADSGGTSAAGAVTWTTDLAASESVSLTATLTVGATAPDLLRLASVACATAANGDAPIVCATDSDLLPAGAAATGTPAPKAPAGFGAWPQVAAAAALVVLVIALLVLAVRRRRARAVD